MSTVMGGSELNLQPGQALRVNRLPIEHRPVPPEQAGGGSPTTGAVTLRGLLRIAGAGMELGVWEMTEGTMYDVEVDELFVVTAGRGTVVIEVPGGSPRRAELEPGTLMRLAAGMKTVWTVTEPLRKVYLSLPESGD